MSKFTCKIANKHALQIKLLRDGYEIINMADALKYDSEGIEIAIQIDTDAKTFKICPAEDCPLAITDENLVAQYIGMKGSIEDYHKDIINDPIKHLVESLKDITSDKNIEKPAVDESVNLTDIVEPGDWVSFTIKNEPYFGLAILNDALLYMTPSGEIKGYLTNFTQKSPFVFNSIRRPSDKHFRLDEYDKMDLIWENKVKVKKTIQEIEKELGLTPGTLSII